MKSVNVYPTRWLHNIFLLGYRKDLEVTDLYSPLDEHSSHQLGDKINKLWNEEEMKKKSKPNLIMVLARCFGKKILVIGCFQAFTELVLRSI